MAAKVCRFDLRVCPYASCSFLVDGEVQLCDRHRGNLHGMSSMKKRVGVSGANPVVLCPAKFVKRGAC